MNNKSMARAVIYIGLLPPIELNKRYAEMQLLKYRQGEVPTDQWHESTDKQCCDYEFSELGKKLMTIIPWEAK